jgi:hypothetical protein
MKKSLICCLFTIAAFSVSLSAQEAKEYPQPEPMRPEMTEYWTPQPRIVTPGAQATSGAPSDAIVLFDGTDLSAWERVNGSPAGWTVHDGVVTVNKRTGDIRTKESFGSFQLHIEWCIPPMDASFTSQSRGNSGVYLQGKYEIQVMDSYNNETYVNGQAGSIYKQTPPLVNAMRAPGEWNVYDIIYTAPVFKEDGSYMYPPRVTVLHNGVLIQNNTEIQGTTEYIGLPKVSPHGDGKILLQSHGDPSPGISYRNIWIRRL